jgi:hypothetical protein
MSLTLIGAQIVADAIDSVADPAERALAVDALRAKEIDPFVEEAWGVDERNIARARHRLFDEPALELPPHPVPEEVFPFMVTERDTWHRTVRKNQLIAHPSTLYDDPGLTARVLAARGGPSLAPPPPVSREECLAVAHEAATR